MNATSNTPALSYDALSVFCCQLSLMLHAGIGSEESVSLLLSDARQPREQELLRAVHAKLLDGAPLADALAAAGAFPAYLLRMVAIGEAAGRLDQVLTALATYYRREADTQRALRRAVAYPAAMALLVAVIFLALVSRVLPVFQQVFAQLGVGLSPVARALLTFGSASQAVTAVLAVILVACALLLFYLVRSRKGAAAYSRLFARSAAGRAVDRSRFASVMALMLSSGLPLDEAMGRTVELLEQSALAPALRECRRRMEEGESFPRAVEGAGLLTGLQAGLLAAGSRAGVTDQAMEELARRCGQEAEERLDSMLSRFEYLLVVVLCLSIALVLLSVMLPLLGVLSAIGG